MFKPNRFSNYSNCNDKLNEKINVCILYLYENKNGTKANKTKPKNIKFYS